MPPRKRRTRTGGAKPHRRRGDQGFRRVRLRTGQASRTWSGRAACRSARVYTYFKGKEDLFLVACACEADQEDGRPAAEAGGAGLGVRSPAGRRRLGRRLAVFGELGAKGALAQAWSRRPCRPRCARFSGPGGPGWWCSRGYVLQDAIATGRAAGLDRHRWHRFRLRHPHRRVRRRGRGNRARSRRKRRAGGPTRCSSCCGRTTGEPAGRGRASRAGATGAARPEAVGRARWLPSGDLSIRRRCHLPRPTSCS